MSQHNEKSPEPAATGNEGNEQITKSNSAQKPTRTVNELLQDAAGHIRQGGKIR